MQVPAPRSNFSTHLISRPARISATTLWIVTLRLLPTSPISWSQINTGLPLPTRSFVNCRPPPFQPHFGVASEKHEATPVLSARGVLQELLLSSMAKGRVGRDGLISIKRLDVPNGAPRYLRTELFIIIENPKREALRVPMPY